MNIFIDLGIILASYIVGAIPFCYILGRIVGKKRLTEIGDKNPGGWNLVFNVSKIWGLIGIFLDMAKGYFAYFFALKLASPALIPAMDITNNQLVAILAGCAAVIGHNYPPYLRFKGGKGIAAWGGFMIAINPLNLVVGGIGIILGLILAKNMIWAISAGIIFCGIFSWIMNGQYFFGIMILFLLLIMIPKQINKNINFSKNFKFRKEQSFGDLFKPKER